MAPNMEKLHQPHHHLPSSISSSLLMAAVNENADVTDSGSLPPLDHPCPKEHFPFLPSPLHTPSQDKQWVFQRLLVSFLSGLACMHLSSLAGHARTCMKDLDPSMVH